MPHPKTGWPLALLVLLHGLVLPWLRTTLPICLIAGMAFTWVLYWLLGLPLDPTSAVTTGLMGAGLNLGAGLIGWGLAAWAHRRRCPACRRRPPGRTT